MSNDKPAIILSTPKSKYSLDGGKEVPCDHCGRLVYLSPSSISIQSIKKNLVICDNCFNKLPDSVKEALVFTTTPEQITEVKNEVERIIQVRNEQMKYIG